MLTGHLFAVANLPAVNSVNQTQRSLGKQTQGLTDSEVMENEEVVLELAFLTTHFTPKQ